MYLAITYCSIRERVIQKAIELIDVIVERLLNRHMDEQRFASNRSSEAFISKDFIQYIMTDVNQKSLINTMIFLWLHAQANEDVAASPVEREQLPNLTEQEKQWIAANPSIRVGNELRWAPFNYHEDGIAKGFSVDYIKLLAAKVGLNVTFIAPSRFDVLLEQTKNTELDVLTDAIRTEEREALLSFSSPYFENKNVIVSLVKRPYTSIKQLEHRKVAVTGGNFLSESSAPSTPWTIESVKHPQDAIQALLDGRVDAALGQHAVMRRIFSTK